MDTVPKIVLTDTGTDTGAPETTKESSKTPAQKLENSKKSDSFITYVLSRMGIKRSNGYVEERRELMRLNHSDIPSMPRMKVKIPCYITSVYDGDTYTGVWKLGKGGHIRQKIRLSGVDTPELRSKNPEEKRAAKVVRDYMKKLIENKIVDIKIKESCKYGERWIAEVNYEGSDISNLLVNKGYAIHYDGKKKREWNSNMLQKILN